MFTEKIDKGFEEATGSTRYRAIEKFESEVQMRFKASIIENFLFLYPFFLSLVVWFSIGIVVENFFLPYPEEFNYFGFGFWIFFFAGAAASYIFKTRIEPRFRAKMDKEHEELTQDVYIKGAKYVTTAGYNRAVEDSMQKVAVYQGERAKEYFLLETIPLARNDKRFEADPEPIKIPLNALTTGIMIMGAPRQGKSVLINNLLSQMTINANRKQVIVDVKGEFVEKFFNPDTDAIVCPSDIRSFRFSIYKLIRTKIDAAVIAQILIPDDKQTQDPHWVDSAKAVMEGVLLYASKRRLSNKEIYEMISDYFKLIEIKQDPEVFPIVANYLRNDGDGVAKETQSIVSSLIRKAKTLQYLAFLDDLKDNREIEFDKWLNDGKGGRLFLLSTENLSKVFAPVYGVIVSYMISTLLDGEDTREKDYFFILDELPRLGRALGENLEKGLAVGPSKGFKAVVALQSFSQLKKEFGQNESESILDTVNSFIVFKNNYGAQFLEKYFGKTHVKRNNDGYSFSMNSMGDRTTLNRQEVKESLIDDSEITRLETFEFYAKIDGCKDVLKSKLAQKFIPSQQGVKKYVENPKMTIERMEADEYFRLQNIENQFFSMSQLSSKTADDPTYIDQINPIFM